MDCFWSPVEMLQLFFVKALVPRERFLMESFSVKSYIGFFALLWFNQLQFTRYDVRFGMDSFFERVCKASVTKASKSSYTIGAPKDPLKNLGSVFHVYDVVFVCFFVAAGCALLTMAILIALTKKNKCAGDYAAIALRAVVVCIGIGRGRQWELHR
ncbi:MAG: hypothetical protein Q9208_002778 [Pyrenodesmia sp. 3 TL-2023]